MGGEDGVAGGADMLAFGFLVFVVGMLLLVNAWSVVDAKIAAAAGAREGVRAFVEWRPGAGANPGTYGEAVARDTVTAHGRRSEHIRRVQFAGDFYRCAPVTGTVEIGVPSVVLPWIGGFGPAFTVRASHTEIVDPFRSGVGGVNQAAGCAS